MIKGPQMYLASLAGSFTNFSYFFAWRMLHWHNQCQFKNFNHVLDDKLIFFREFWCLLCKMGDLIFESMQRNSEGFRNFLEILSYKDVVRTTIYWNFAKDIRRFWFLKSFSVFVEFFYLFTVFTRFGTLTESDSIKIKQNAKGISSFGRMKSLLAFK